MLWDDNAEGGDSLCLVLKEREAAAAYSHDLAGEGETDSASFRLRGEERDEDVGGYIFGDETSVVAHVDDDGFLSVGVGLETDKCLLACRGFQICGAAFLLVFSFLFLESFYGILQKIRYNVREEALIGVNQQIFGRNFYLYIVVTEDKDLKQGLETIHKTGTELLAFVNNYRRFTHVPQPQPALFYVEPFLERMAMLCNHDVEIEVSPKDLLVYADESLLSHVVTNLLKNAVEAFKEKGQLSAERNKQDGNEQGRNKQECRSADLQSAASKKAFIHLQAYANAQESIIIDVSNNAGLIPEDVASHIFIPFFTTKPEGSGIGLSLSRQIMRVSGGSLSLHQDKAQGITTFRIIIP